MFGAPTGWIGLILKRARFAARVKRICKKKKFPLEKNGFFWWLGKNKSEKHNFTVICGEERYSVKLIGVRNPAILFGFVNETTYEIKDYTFVLPNAMDSVNYTLKAKDPYRFPEETHPCIVMVPHSVKVTLREHNERKQRKEIGSHDKAPEGEFFFGENFLQFLKDQ